MIAFLFPGQGSQRVGMGRALAEAFPICRETFDEADRELGEPLSRLCFEGPEDALRLTEHTQPAILTVSVAAFRVLESRGVMPGFVAGHSLGEYSANVAAGTLSFGDALRLVRRRGRYMQEAVPVGEGAMAAILGLDAEGVAAACAEAQAERRSLWNTRPVEEFSTASPAEVVSPANLNAPGQVVIAGSREAVRVAGEKARARGARRVMPLPVSAPFHCALMEPAARRLEPELRASATGNPRVPVVANVDAEIKRDGPSCIDALVRQVAAPVLWERVVARLASEGVRAYVEVGPGTVLTGLVRKIHRDAAVLNFEVPDQLAAIDSLHA